MKFYKQKDIKRKKEISNLIYSHPLWIKKSIELRKERKCCNTCGSKKSLQVHHKFYKKGVLIWDYPDEALEILCRKCHDETHKKYRMSYFINLGKTKRFQRQYTTTPLMKRYMNGVYERKYKPIFAIYLYAKEHTSITKKDLTSLYWISGLKEKDIMRILKSEGKKKRAKNKLVNKQTKNDEIFITNNI